MTTTAQKFVDAMAARRHIRHWFRQTEGLRGDMERMIGVDLETIKKTMLVGASIERSTASDQATIEFVDGSSAVSRHEVSNDYWEITDRRLS